MELQHPIQKHLVNNPPPDYTAYYNGKMSYRLHGTAWATYVAEAFSDLASQTTSENIFKTVIDLFAENLVPVPEELRGFSNVVVPLLSRGEALCLVTPAGEVHFPEHYRMLSDGKYTMAAIYTRNLQELTDNITFADSTGVTWLYSKAIPADLAPADTEGYSFIETITGNTLIRFALDDKGFGATLASLQDRVNHSIIDQTVVAEMYARPFWYLLNVELPPKNPYLPATSAAVDEALQERNTGASGHLFTTSSEGPFGQLDPPTIGDMIAYHDSIIDKVSQSTGIPQHYFKPGQGVPPTGVALKVLSKRFNNKVARIREDLEPQLEELATLLGLEKTGTQKDADGNEEKVYEFWSTDDDLLQESLDQHGISLSQMGYPLGYIAEVVTPGVDLDDYADDTEPPLPAGAAPGQAPDMTAMGQTGLPATPGQVASYAQNPGQRQKARA